MPTSLTITDTHFDLLARAVEATLQNKVVYAAAADIAVLQSCQLVEANPAMLCPEDGVSIAYRATQVGINYVDQQVMDAEAVPCPPDAPIVQGYVVPDAPYAAPIEAEQPTTPPAAFPIISSGFVAPEKAIRTGGTRTKLYPFETMELGEVFFVPATPERPDPKKSLASTVSSANKRFAEFVPRKFFMSHRALKGQIFGREVAVADGVYIQRIEAPTNPTQDEQPA